MKLEILKPFGPSIAKVKIPEDIISGINNHIDDLIKDKEKTTKFDYGSSLAGNVTQEFLLDIEFMQKIKWVEFLASSSQRWLQDEHNISLKKFEILTPTNRLIKFPCNNFFLKEMTNP